MSNSAQRAGALALTFLAVAIGLYWRVLDAPFFSDDHLYMLGNPWVKDFSVAHLTEMLKPHSGVSTRVLNYAPVHLLLHSATWGLFGNATLGHHLVNVSLHVLASLLLVAVLVRSGLSEKVSAFGGFVFLVHPANVEAVAWISQLKTSAAGVLALSALLWLERRPGRATLAFGLALATKALAAFALPVAAFEWWRRGSGADGFARTRTILVVWAALFALIAAAQFIALWSASLGVDLTTSPLDVRLRSSFALLLRYALMATTTVGLSAFHEPTPVRAWSDPYWLVGLLLAVAIGVRALWAWRQRRVEAVFWLWAGISFAPVSQWVPFQFAMGDRYLYLILPGLIGAVSWLLVDLASRTGLAQRIGAPLWTVAALVLIVAFAGRAVERAGVWSKPAQLMAESIENYPEGMNAAITQATALASNGNADAALAVLVAANERGMLDVSRIVHHPAFTALRRRTQYHAIVEPWARRWIEKYRALEQPSQFQWYGWGMAHEALREQSQARHAYQKGLEHGGVYDKELRARLRALGY